VARAVVTGVAVLGLLAASSGCEVRSSVDGAQTAVAIAQTALPGIQTALPRVQAVAVQLQALLAGAHVEVETEPDGAPNEQVSEVKISATDAQGAFAQLEPSAQQATAGAALLLVGQYYPNATVSLSIADERGELMVSGTRAPGQPPSVQTP
jgi:hypothetical protein